MITTNSLGRRIAKTDEQIAAFWRWFGDSKVVDEKGRPLVVYHATDSAFSAFSLEKSGENTDFNATDTAFAATAHIGFWFSEHPDIGSRLGCAYTVPAYLSVSTPKHVTLWRTVDMAHESAEDENDSARTVGRRVRSQLLMDGYDGLSVEDHEFGGLSFVALSSTQVKSAIGNRGTFDPSDPVITNPRRNPAPPEPKTIRITKRLLTTAPDGVRIYQVSGKAVRDRWADFVGGSHHWANRFVPKGEIWLEKLRGKKEMALVGAHEMIERILMKYFGWSYERAHNKANDLETDLRKTKNNELFITYCVRLFGKSKESTKLGCGLRTAFQNLP
jgi:hypothetical protein